MKRSYLIRLLMMAVVTAASGACCAQYLPAATQRIDSVKQAGIYRIVLPPAFVAQCRADLSDLRIHDDYDKEAPYVLKVDPHDSMNAGFLSIPDPRIRQKDSSDRYSYYWLAYDDNYRIDRLSVVITGPALYKRDAEVFVADRPQSTIPVAGISIDPADSVFELPHVRTKRLLIKVANHDNAPLRIVRVATAQSGIYLLAYLQPGRAYRLLAGDNRFSAPDYDLHYFTDNARLAPATIGLGPLRRLSAGEAVEEEYGNQNAHAARSRVILWSIVTSILLFLIYVSVKLAKAVDKKTEQ